MGENNHDHNGAPNRFSNFRANNPSDVFTQKHLCNTGMLFFKKKIPRIGYVLVSDKD